MNKISVVVIAKNEEKNIKDCLNSVGWADQKIVVIDSSSEDKTENIARKFADSVYVRMWEGYGGQKNFGIEKAKNEWIFNLDADERVSSELSYEIQTTLKESPEVDGYYIPFKNYIGNRWLKHGGLYPDYHLRLFRKRCGVFEGRYGGKVHEQVHLKKVGYLKGSVEHYTYKNLGDYLAKVRKYATLEAEDSIAKKDVLKWKETIKPVLRFLKIYFFQRGFLDGWFGFINALMLSYYLTYKLYKIKKIKQK
ncbi:MAG: glycosyltransferase family 2 protein [Patescibacteria group bacterium]|nr:glycosyltransferase family 2 protein [Patescibacteria group bacterium]